MLSLVSSVMDAYKEHVHLGRILCVSGLGSFVGSRMGPDRVQCDQSVLVDQVAGPAILVWDLQDVVPANQKIGRVP